MTVFVRRGARSLDAALRCDILVNYRQLFRIFGIVGDFLRIVVHLLYNRENYCSVRTKEMLGIGEMTL